MLTVFPHPARRDADLWARGSAFLDDRCTIGELVRALGAGVRPERRVVDRVGARRLLREVLRRTPDAAGPYAAIAATHGLVRGLARTFAALAEGDVEEAELRWAPLRVADGAARLRLEAVARLRAAYHAELETRGLCDGPGLLQAAARWVEAGGALPERWRAAAGGGVEAVDVLDVGPARGRLLRALGARLRLPYDPARPALFAYLAPAVAGGTVDAYDPIHADADPRLAHLLRGLFRPTGARDPEDTFGVTAAARSADEPRAVAAYVRTLCDRGVAPDAIAVALPGLDRQADRVREALARAGVPCACRRGPSVAAAPPATLVLDVLRAARHGFPREALAALLGSRYLDPPADARGRAVGRLVPGLLRAAGVRDDRPPGALAADLEAHLARLDAAAGGRPPRAAGGGGAADGALRAAAAHVARLCETWRPLGEPGPAAARLRLLRASLEALGWTRRAGAAARAGPGRAPDADDALRARDQAAVSAAAALCEEIAAALGGAVLEPAALAAHVEDALSSTTLAPASPRGGAVVLCDVRELGGAAFDHVVLAALQDGRFPARPPGDPVLSDGDRHALNAALGRPALRLQQARAGGPAGSALPARETLDPLVFYLALCAARRGVRLFHARADDLGRALGRSPFVDEVLRAHPRGEAAVDALPVSPIPAAPHVFHPADARARVALEGGRTADGSAPPPDLHLALARAAVERAREEFFLGRGPEAGDGRPDAALDGSAASAGPYVGVLALVAAREAGAPARGGATSDAALRAALRRHVADAPDAPGWSATRLADYARCPFHYFAKRVLGLRPGDERGEALDARAGGKLLHRVLEAALRALDSAALLPVTAQAAQLDRVLSVAAAAAMRALDAWEAAEHRGHPGLWALWRENALATLDAVLRLEAEQPLFPTAAPMRPAGFEVAFGEPDARPALALPSPDGAETVHLYGRIDRVDRGGAAVPGGAAAGLPGEPSSGPVGVVDYKSGPLPPLRKLVEPDALGETEFQLPVYLAVVARDLAPGATDLHAVYLSLRDRGATKDLAGQLAPAQRAALVALDPAARAALRTASGAARAPANLADAVWRLVERVRAGDFAVRPRDCTFCDYARACRVQVHARA
ncbi:MAG TPA: PD-(D/E)XK nuclease family protein [Myxococcota bacterium]|nr:PD-(D/E)XK nuclease family protein [Myxococcota bacterium]